MAVIKTVDGVQHIVGSTNQLLNPFTILEGLDVSAGKVVADFGCGGVGYFVFAASELVGDKGKVYAVDILKTNLDAVKKKIREESIYNIQTIWSNLEIYGGTNIPENSLDVGLLINVLFQSSKHKEVFRESHRLLKKGGMLAIIDWKSKAMPFGPPSGNRLDKEKTISNATMSGFRVDNQFEAGKYHYAIKFIKV
jgi:ubiquinone/menaquinone biosynthesis C-methylase UbiE